MNHETSNQPDNVVPLPSRPDRNINGVEVDDRPQHPKLPLGEVIDLHVIHTTTSPGREAAKHRHPAAQNRS